MFIIPHTNSMDGDLWPDVLAPLVRISKNRETCICLFCILYKCSKFRLNRAGNWRDAALSIIPHTNSMDGDLWPDVLAPLVRISKNRETCICLFCILYKCSKFRLNRAGIWRDTALSIIRHTNSMDGDLWPIVNGPLVSNFRKSFLNTPLHPNWNLHAKFQVSRCRRYWDPLMNKWVSEWVFSFIYIDK